MDKRAIPNLLTFFRVLAVPAALTIAVGFPAWHTALFWLFLAAAVTDFFDGYLARKWQAISPLGTLLDPVADKLLVAVILLYLVEYTIAPLGAVAVIILRELYIAGLREFLASRGASLPVSAGGKWKTALQLAAIACLLATLAYRLPYLWNGGIILLWLSALLSLFSAVGYSRKAWPLVRR